MAIERPSSLSVAHEPDGLPSLPVLLLRARVSVAGRFNKKLRQHGLTEQQWRILRNLSTEDFTDVTKLAKRIDLFPSSLSRILRDLDRRRLIVRMTSRDDARRTLAIITPEGRQLVAETMEDMTSANTEVEKRFGRDNMLDLRLRLADLIDALDDAAEGAPADES